MSKHKNEQLTLYRHALYPMKGVPGISPKLRAPRMDLISAQGLSLLEELLDVVCPASELPAYYYRVLSFVVLFCEVEEKGMPEDQLCFHLIDLADYCVGLPAKKRTTVFLEDLYEAHSSPRLRIAAAECVGNMRSGLGSAGRLFLPLLSAPEESTRRRSVEAVARVFRVQSGLIRQAGESADQFHADYISTLTDLVAFREQIIKLLGSESLSELLADAGCVSKLEFLAEAQKRDQDCFRDNKEMLLREHHGEFVAIRNGEIVGFAKDTRGIERLIKERIGTDARVFVEKVEPQAFVDKAPATIFTG